MKPIIGIYKLNFANTDKVYIGKSKNIYYRFIKHVQNMRNFTASKKLIEAYTEYGLPTLEILCECNINELHVMEIEAINIFDSINNGFNTNYPIQNTYYKKEDSLHVTVKYSRQQIEDAFLYLIDNPELEYQDIEDLTEVNKSTLAMICSGTNHTWLQFKYPDKYNNLILNGRNKIHQHKDLNKLIKFVRLSNENLNLSYKELADILEISSNILANVATGRTGSKLLEKYIPEEYNKFMFDKPNKFISHSKTTARAKGIVLPKLINITTGEIVDNIDNIAEFCRQYNLNASGIGKVLKGTRKSHKDWQLATTEALSIINHKN